MLKFINLNSPRPLPPRGEDIFNRIRNDKEFLVLFDKILNDVSWPAPFPSQPSTGSQSVTSFLFKECPPSKRARKPPDWGALDSDDDIVSGDRKFPEFVVLDSDDDIASGDGKLPELVVLDFNDDIVSGDRKLPELVVLDSDDDIVSGNRSVSDIENGIVEEIARLDSLNQ